MNTARQVHNTVIGQFFEHEPSEKGWWSYRCVCGQSFLGLQAILLHTKHLSQEQYDEHLILAALK